MWLKNLPSLPGFTKCLKNSTLCLSYPVPQESGFATCLQEWFAIHMHKAITELKSTQAVM